MSDISDNTSALTGHLRRARRIAVVGHSEKPHRDSYRVAQYLRMQGYEVIPINPRVPSIDGHPSYPTLADVPGEIDIVDVFRNKDHLPGIVDEAIEAGATLIWGQFSVTHPDAAQRAADSAVDIVMDRCIKVEHARLLG